MKSFRFITSFLTFILSSASYAELVCKGSAHGLDSIYVFQAEAGKSKDLKIHAKTKMGKELISEYIGVAKYSSTVVSSVLGSTSPSESYYVFVPEKNSYTELIALESDLRSAARSRPMPTSSSGNFMVFSCSGSL